MVVAAVITLSVLARRPGYAVQPIMIAVPTGAIGVLIARHQPRNPNGWLLLGIAAALLLSTVAGAYALIVYHIGHHLPFGSASLILYQLWSPALALYLLIILLFPDGHVPAPRWRWAVWAYSLLCGGYLALLIGVVVDAIDRHRLQVDSYGGLTAIDYPAGRFALAQDTILVLTLALGLSFIARTAAHLAPVVRGATPAAEVADGRGRHRHRVCRAERARLHRAVRALGVAERCAQHRLRRAAGQYRRGHPAVPAVRDRPADLQDAGVHDRYGTTDRRLPHRWPLWPTLWCRCDRRSLSPWRRWLPSRCSTRCAAASSERWTGGSTALATTPRR